MILIMKRNALPPLPHPLQAQNHKKKRKKSGIHSMVNRLLMLSNESTYRFNPLPLSISHNKLSLTQYLRHEGLIIIVKDGGSEYIVCFFFCVHRSWWVQLLAVRISRMELGQIEWRTLHSINYRSLSTMYWLVWVRRTWIKLKEEETYRFFIGLLEFLFIEFRCTVILNHRYGHHQRIFIDGIHYRWEYLWFTIECRWSGRLRFLKRVELICIWGNIWIHPTQYQKIGKKQ